MSSLHTGSYQNHSHSQFSLSSLPSGAKQSEKIFCRGSHWFDKFNVILDSKTGIDFWLKGKRSFLHLKLVHLRFKSLSNKLI